MVSLLLLGCALLILQTTILHELPLWELRIDGLIPLVVYGSLYLDATKGIVLVFLLGMLLDVFTGGSVLGTHLLAFVLLFALIRILRRSFMIKNVYHKVVLVFLMSVLANLGILVLNVVLMDSVLCWHYIVIGLVQSLLTAALSPVFFRVFDYLDTLLGLREIREAAK